MFCLALPSLPKFLDNSRPHPGHRVHPLALAIEEQVLPVRRHVRRQIVRGTVDWRAHVDGLRPGTVRMLVTDEHVRLRRRTRIADLHDGGGIEGLFFPLERAGQRL